MLICYRLVVHVKLAIILSDLLCEKQLDDLLDREKNAFVQILMLNI